MSNKEAARLIIENIQMLDDAATLLSDISNDIFSEIGTFIEKSLDTFEDNWSGNFEWTEKSTIWFIPSIWRIQQEDSFCDISWYELQWTAKNESIADHYWLTSLFPTGKESVGILWQIGCQHFKENPKKMRWNAFAQEMERKYPQLLQLGFKFDIKNGTWWIPLQLDVTHMAKNYVSDTLEYAFTPITDALKKLQEAHPHFMSIIEDAKKAFGGLALEDESETPNAINQ